jgi:hypothetical protein
LEQLRLKREKIEREHTGLRGVSNWIYAQARFEPSYDQETQLLDEAKKGYENVGREASWSQKITASNQREQSGMEYANLQSGIRAAQMTLAGDPQGAQREQFEQVQADQRTALVDGNGNQSAQVKLFDQKFSLERQELAGKQAHERQELESESARAIADIQGEAHEAQLRALGQSDEADRHQLVRSGQDKVRILREQADAPNGAAEKTQLFAQIDAQQNANTQEVATMDARQQEGSATAAAESQTQAGAEKDGRQQQFDASELETLQENGSTSGLGTVGQYEGLREGLVQRQTQTGRGSAEPGDAAENIREYLAHAQNAGAGRIMSAEQYGDSLLASALHGNGSAEALGLAGGDLETLGGGGGLTSNLGEVGQKLNSAADKWSHIADQMRNVTILTMGR